MILHRIDLDVANANSAGYADDDAAGDAGALTLAATSAGDGFAHKVIWTPATGTGVSGNITIVGTDADGKALTESLATNGANAVTSAGYFLTITSITNPTVGGNTVDAGWVDEAVSPTYQLDAHSQSAASLKTIVTGTVDYDVQALIGVRVADYAAPQQTGPWVPITAFDGKTAAVEGSAPLGTSAIRILTNSYTDTAEVQLYVAQPTGNV